MNKKMIASILSVCMVLSLLLCGCTKNGGKDDQTTKADGDSVTTAAPEDTTLTPDVPDSNFGGYTFRILGQGGAGWTASDILRPENFTEDGLNDAKLKRYMNVEEKYHVTIETTLTDTIMATVQGGVLSNDFSFDLINMDTGNTSSAALNKLLVNLTEVPHLDLSRPYYDQNYIHDMSYAGKIFSVVTDLTTMDMFVTWIMMYNKNMIERHDLESPYDLVKRNEWTLDKFNSMLKDVSVENGDGKWNELDTYGFAAHTGSARNLYYAAGLTICTKDENTDTPVLSIGDNSERLTLVADKVSDLLYNDNKTLMNTKIVEAFEEGRALFLAEITGYLGRFREMNDNFDVLSGKQKRDPGDYVMLDLIRNSRVFDFGLFNNLGTISSLFNTLASTKTPKVASMLKSGVKSGLKALNKMLEKYENIK